MKKALFLWIAGLVCPAIAFPQFRIEGKLGKGIVCLVSEKDTLARTVSGDGGFVLQGKTEQPVVAFLTLNGVKYTTLLFLENAEYKVSPGKEARSLSVEGGGVLQQLEAEYRRAFEENDRETEDARNKLDTARKKEVLFEVMLHRTTLVWLDSVRNDIENRFIARHPESLVSLYHFYKGLKKMSPARLMAKYPLLGERARETEWGKVITAAYENWNKLSPGHTAPDFTLHTPDGRPVCLHEVKARVKLLDFWASWCGPCRAESPELVRIYNQYKDQGLEIVSVSLDHKLPAWKKAIETDGLHWIHLSSLQGWHCPVASLYRIHSVPACFVLDSDNRIVAVKVWEKELEEAIKTALKVER